MTIGRMNYEFELSFAHLEYSVPELEDDVLHALSEIE